jgi:hypothetical protein
MKDRKFDCVALQHRGAAKIYEETKGMTIAEELAFWERRTQELQQLQQTRRQAKLKGVLTEEFQGQ